LSQGAWDKLLAALAREGLDYADFHRVQAAFFGARGCGVDSDRLADVTLDLLAEQIDQGARIRNLVAYTRGIARHVYCAYCAEREDFRETARQIEYLANGGLQEPEEKPDLRRRCQKSCLRTLSEAELTLVVDYFLSGRSREELAAERGWSTGKLYVRIYRIRRRLKKCVKACRKKG
jgi:DNA-directed RNA polymerase specialized sigma24 family protein